MFWMKFQSNKIRLCEFKLGELSHETCSYVEIKCQLYARDDIYCRFYCLLNMFRAPLCPSSAARHTDNLKTKAPNTIGSNHLYNTLELLMMGIMVPETCWASNKICNKYHLLHPGGILFPHKMLYFKSYVPCWFVFVSTHEPHISRLIITSAAYVLFPFQPYVIRSMTSYCRGNAVCDVAYWYTGRHAAPRPTYSLSVVTYYLRR